MYFTASYLWSLIAVAMTLMGVTGTASAQGTDSAPAGPVAVVNGQPLRRVDWDNALRRIPPPQTTLTDTQRKALHLNLLGLLIDDMLMRQFLHASTPPVDPAQVTRRINEIEASLKARKLTLQDYLRDSHETLDGLRTGLAAEMQWQVYVNGRLAGVNLQKYYEDNKEMFDGVLIRVSHIVLPVPPNSDPKAVHAATAKLETVRQQILKGLDFAEAARRHSQDDKAKYGGDLGYFPPRRAENDPFIRTASHLKVGEVSDVVRTDFACHLIKMTERKPGTTSTFEEVKDSVRAVYADELKMALIAELRKTAKIDVRLP